MSKLVYYVAVTVDGYIAREDGSFDFFPTEGEHFARLISEYPETFPAPARAALGIDGPNRRFGAVLMGRRTYEVGSLVGLTSPYPQLEQYVVSAGMAGAPHDDAVEVVGDDVVGLVRRLKARDGLDVWLCGGAALAASLASEIDELILKVNPVVLGAGLPMFAGAAGPTRVALVESTRFDNGFLLNRYETRRETA